jgi:hypothetical protein
MCTLYGVQLAGCCVPERVIPERYTGIMTLDFKTLGQILPDRCVSTRGGGGGRERSPALY